VLEGLWALQFGPNVMSGDLSQNLYFTSGPGDEMHGRFGMMRVAP
jgi:hypothetical protein